MTDLVTWLRAQLDTIEAKAPATDSTEPDERPVWTDTYGEFHSRGGPIFDHVLEHCPRHVLRQVQAHRAILDAYERRVEAMRLYPNQGNGNAMTAPYPSGTRVFEVTDCTFEGCGGKLKAVLRRVDSLLPSALICDADETHTIPASEWLTLGRKLRRAA